MKSKSILSILAIVIIALTSALGLNGQLVYADTNSSERASTIELPDSIVQSEPLHTIELGKVFNGEYFKSNSFSSDEMVTIKFKRFDSSPITSFSVFIADIDVTDYVIHNGVVITSDNYIEVLLPELAAETFSDITGQADNLITLTVNGESYTTILFVESDRKTRAAPAIPVIVVACVGGATVSAAVQLFDIFFDTKWFDEYIIPIPYPALNGREISIETISTEKYRIVESAVLGCAMSVGMEFIMGAAFTTTFIQKANTYLVEKISSASALSPLLKLTGVF